MGPKVYLAALEGSLKKINNSEPWQDQVTATGNTVVHVHVGKPLEEGKVKIEFIEMVLDQGTGYSLLWHENDSKEIPLHLAARFGHDEAVEEFLRRVKSVNEEDVTKMLKMTNKRGDTALHEAARGGHVRVVKLLVEADPNCPHEPNGAGENPLYLAAESGSTASVTSIVNTCAPSALTYSHRGPCGRTALHAAVQWGTPEMLQKILDKDGSLALLRVQDDQGLTPLHCVAAESKTQLLQVLLSYDDKVTSEPSAVYIRDNKGQTALHIATLHCNWDRIKELIAARPDIIEIVDNKGQNVVHYAANWACIRKLHDFLELGPFSKLMNDGDLEGNTPLHLFAASMRYITCPCLYGLPYFVADQRIYLKAFNNQNLTVGDIFASHRTNEELAILLTKRVAPKGRRITREIDVEAGRLITTDVLKKRGAFLKDAAQSRLVVAALIATVSFTAGFTVPGGFNQNPGPDVGLAVLSKKAAFKAFLISDTIAFAFSSFAVLLYFILAGVVGHSSQLLTSNIAYVFNVISLGAMVIAFATGVCAIVPHSRGVTLAVLVVFALFFFYYAIFFVRILVSGVVYANSCYIKINPV